MNVKEFISKYSRRMFFFSGIFKGFAQTLSWISKFLKTSRTAFFKTTSHWLSANKILRDKIRIIIFHKFNFAINNDVRFLLASKCDVCYICVHNVGIIKLDFLVINILLATLWRSPTKRCFWISEYDFFYSNKDMLRNKTELFLSNKRLQIYDYKTQK